MSRPALPDGSEGKWAMHRSHGMFYKLEHQQDDILPEVSHAPVNVQEPWVPLIAFDCFYDIVRNVSDSPEACTKQRQRLANVPREPVPERRGLTSRTSSG